MWSNNTPGLTLNWWGDRSWCLNALASCSSVVNFRRALNAFKEALSGIKPRFPTGVTTIMHFYTGFSSFTMSLSSIAPNYQDRLLNTCSRILFSVSTFEGTQNKILSVWRGRNEMSVSWSNHSRVKPVDRLHLCHRASSQHFSVSALNIDQGPGLVLEWGKWGAQGAKFKEALILRCWPSTCMSLRTEHLPGCPICLPLLLALAKTLVKSL